MKRLPYRFQFQYGYWKQATVTVWIGSDNEQLARSEAATEMDRRYAAQNREPPVGWTLVLIDKGEHH